MDKANEKQNLNKKINFNDKIAFFQNKRQNSSIEFYETNNKLKKDLKEEKTKEKNNASNINNQFNKKEKLENDDHQNTFANKVKENTKPIKEKEDFPFRNTSFHASLNVFNSNKDNKSKKPINEVDKKNENIKIENNKLEKEKKKDDEIKTKDNSSITDEKSLNFKDKINSFNPKPNSITMKKENSQNIIKPKNSEIKEKINSKFSPQETKGEIRTTSTAFIKSNLKIDNGSKNDNSNKNNSKKIPQNENKLTNNSITQRANIFNQMKSNEKKNESNNSRRGTVILQPTTQIDVLNYEEGEIARKSSGYFNKNKSNNNSQMSNIQQRILNMQNNNKNDEKKAKEKEVNKDEAKKSRIDQSILERLKLFYTPTGNEKEKDNNINTTLNKNKINENNKNETNISDNNIIKEENNKKNESEKEISASQLVSMKMTMHINDIKNKNKNNSISSPAIPKKLNLNEIFKKMNIEQFASSLKEGKREEIMKLAQREKEEDNCINIRELEKEEEENKNENEESISNQQDKEQNLNIEERFDSNLNIQEDENFEQKKETDNIINNNNDLLIEKKENSTKEKQNNKKEKRHKKKLSSVINKIKDFGNSLINNITHSEKEEKLENNKSKNEIDDQEIQNVSKRLFYDSTISNRESFLTFNPKDSEVNLKQEKKHSTKHSSYLKFAEKKSEKKDIIGSILSEDPKLKADINVKIEDILLPMKNISEKEEKEIKKDNFCESFFLASVPYENGKIVENSENNIPDCQHDFCAYLPAMQPEIIYKYPKEDIKGLEINNLAASICFPNGIKMCYEKEEEKIKTVKNYRSSFTNQVGERFFAMTYHFFLKMALSDFFNTYKTNSLVYQMTNLQDEFCVEFNDMLVEDITKKLEMFSEFCSRDYVYIPYCLCLISKYPFFTLMEKCLESIMITINNDKISPMQLNELIAYIVKSIPAPPLKSKVSFALPYINKFCEIQQLYFEDILQYGDNPSIIFKHLSINHIICLFKLLIFEQKILIVGKDNDIISQIILNFMSLLYPFEWIHTNIPIMSEKMLKFLQAFLPYFNGLNTSLYEKAKSILAKAPKGVFIFNIDKDTIDINTNLRPNTKYIKGSAYINKYLDTLPKNIENLLLKELKSIKNDYENTQNHNIENTAINIRMRNLFIHAFVELLYDYNRYSHVIDDYPVFNSCVMIEEKPKNEKSFYKEFTSTQLFQMFLQNSLFKDEHKTYYFDERIKIYNELKIKEISSSYIFSACSKLFEYQYLSYSQINKNYILKPFFIKKLVSFEEKYESKNKAIKYIDLVSFISDEQKNSIAQNLNNTGVLKENKRIVNKKIELCHENDPQNYNIFLIMDKPKEDIKENDIDSDIKKDDENQSKDSLDNSSNKKRKRTSRMTIISADGKSNSISRSYCIRNKENELSEDEKDEIKDTIREIMTRVYKSEIKNIKEDVDSIMGLMEIKFGRDYLLNILVGNKKEHSMKIVQKDSFDFLQYVIFNSLLKILRLEENDENIKYALKLTKACLYIKNIKNKKEILLSDVLFSRLENYSLFTKKIFWIKWIEDEMTDSDIQIYKIYKKDPSSVDKDNDNNYKLYLKHSYEIIYGIPSIMMRMGLQFYFIYLTVSELIQEYIFNDEHFDQLMKELINELQFYKKLAYK